MLMEQAERWRSNPRPFAFVHRIIRGDGSLRHIEARGWVREGEAPDSDWAVGTAHDITEKVREDAERVALAASREQLLRELAVAEARERERIAGDIHDDTVQALDAVSLRLERLVLEEPGAQRREQLEDVLQDVLGAAVRLRTLTFQLLPPPSEGRLCELLEMDLAAILDGQDLSWTLNCTPCFVGRDQKLLVLRFVREAARNIVKHAFAGNVVVRVTRSTVGLRVEVQDDGIGMPHDAPDPMHAGLRLMRERLGAAGGSIELTAGPDGRGTLVAAEFPTATGGRS
jgi:signal transduction histidine kinase